MKKIGIRIIFALILVTALVIGTVSVTSAAPPQRVFINITDLSIGSMSFDYNWEKKGAHYYQIHIYQDTFDPANIINTGNIISLGGRTPSYSGTQTWVNEAVVAGHDYLVYIRLFSKNMKLVKHGNAIDSEYLPSPP